MEVCRLLSVTLLVLVAMVSCQSDLPGTDPVISPKKWAELLKPHGWPPRPLTVRPPPWRRYTPRPPVTVPPKTVIDPPRFCLCVVRCCTHPLQKRSALSANINLPLIRHKRCCGCRDCGLAWA